MEVDSAQTVVHRRFVEVTVVVDPTTDAGIYQPGQIIKGRVGPVLETPSPDFPTHRLECSVGRRGQKRDAICSVGPGRKPRLEWEIAKAGCSSVFFIYIMRKMER